MPIINGSDPSLNRPSTTPSVARTSPPTVSSNGTATSSGTTIARGITPIVSGNDVSYPQATESTTSRTVTITSSPTNDAGDIVTVYTSPTEISVSSINQTINNFTSEVAGVSEIIAGNGITITSTGTGGTGSVTINTVTGSFGNIAVLNLNGNPSTVLQGDGNWGVVTTNYSNSNVASYLPTYTGNLSPGNLTVSTKANLGSVGNVIITGGTSGQVLSTDGAGNLSWSTGGSGSGYIIPYTVDTFVANTPPGFGEITFCNLEGANSAPSTAQKLFISESPTNEQSLGTIFQQWTSNSYRGTLSLNNGSDSQATFNISNGRIYFEPEVYRGFQAGLNQIWGDDCSINQLIITNASAPKFYNTDFLVEDDVFHATGLATGNTHVMLNVYGSSQYNPINPNDLWNTFVAFVDNVLYDGETLRTNPDDIKTQFYNNTGSFRNNIPTQDLYQYFRFTSSSDADYFGTAPTTGGSGTGATVRIRVNPNNTYTVLGTALPGVGYIGGETLTVLGTDLGGASPDNDLTILIDSVDGDGVITAVSYDSGTGVYPWPTNSISDGSDDQYDVGNYLNTNLASEISYANGITQTASAAFGGGDYCVMYYQSFFCMVATGVGSSVSELFYSGNLGFDGDGLLNWTGLRSNQDVIANNNALYAYFDSEYLDGELTPTVGTTYNMTLDSAGINLDGFYAYNDPDSNDHYFGSNTDWRLESQSQLFVQSYNEMIIQTLVNQRGIGETGPALTVRAGSGSPGQKEINATAGNGGTVNIRAGSAGGSDGIDSLGNTGGDVVIEAGEASGNSTGGNVYISGGDSSNGTAGKIRLTTSNGTVGNGRVEIYTTDGTERNWAFNANGTTIFPTLTVDLHNGGNQEGQVLQFGDNTQQVIITGPTPEVDSNSQRLIIQGQRGNGQYSEGGDVYVWAGDADTYGGDIKIYAGDADNVSAGYGGYVNIEGGQGFNEGGYVRMTAGQSSNGAGATASVVGGYGNTSGGDANLQGGQGTVAGGNVNISAGYGSGGSGGNVTIVAGGSANGLTDYGNINLSAGASSWVFGNDGNLTLPSNDFTVNYANGTQVSLGSTALGNITVNDITLQGVSGYSGGIQLSASPEDTANLKYLQVRSGDLDSHIHFDTGNNNAYDQYFGDDFRYLKVEAGLTGNVSIGTYQDGGVGPIEWIFDSNGNLTLPGSIIGTTANNNGYIQWVGNSSGDGYGYTTLQLCPDNTLSSDQMIIIDPTAPNHIHIRAGGFQDNTSAQLFLGGENSYFSVGAGVDPSVYIAAADNQWTFSSTDGNLTLPTGGVINYANGTQYGGSSYGDSNVSTLLSSFGSNTISTTGNISVGAVTATGKIGYANGGTVTQSGTGQGVTLNQLTGQITMFKSSWNAGDTEVFNISCNKVENADYVMVQTIGTPEASYFNTVAYPYTPVANSIRVHVTALETATTAPVVQFLILKAATA